MPKSRSIDIDDIDDLRLAEFYKKTQRKKFLRQIKKKN